MSPVRDQRSWMQEIERRSAAAPAVRAAAVETATAVTDAQEEVRTGGTPAAPVELVYQTAFYLDTSGRRRVRFLLDFPDVVKAIDGTDVAVGQYELWGRDVSPSVLETTTSAAAGLAVPGLTLPGLVRPAAVQYPPITDTWNCPPGEAPAPVVLVPDAPALEEETPASSNGDAGTAAEPVTVVPDQEPKWSLVKTSELSSFRADGFLPNTIWTFRVRAVGPDPTVPGEWSEEIVAVVMAADTAQLPQPTAPVLTVERGTITAKWDGQSVLGTMPADFKYAVLAHGQGSSPTFEIARFGRGGGFKVVAELEYYDPQFFRVQAVDESGNKSAWSEQAVAYTTPLVDKDIILSTIDAAKTHLKNINAGVSILPNSIVTEHLVVTEEMTAALANFLVVKADHIDANSLWADEAFFGLADAKLFRGDAFEGKTFEGGIFTLTGGGMFRTDVAEYTGIKWDSAGIRAWSPLGGVPTFELVTATGDLSVFGGTFTGAKVQTDPGAAKGLKFTSAGLQMWDPAGKKTVDMNAATGYATLTGRLRTAPDGQPGVVLIPSVESDDGKTMAMWLAPDTATIAGLVTAGVYMSNPATSATAGQIHVRGQQYGGVRLWDAVQLDSYNASIPQIFSNHGAGLQMTAYSGSLYLAGTGGETRISSTDNTVINVGALKQLTLQNAGAAYNRTNGASANLVVLADGNVFKSTSALKYKIDPRPMALDRRLLENVRVKDWVDVGMAERYAEEFNFIGPRTEQGQREFDALSLARIPGAIVEDVVAAGGEQFAVRDLEGELDGLMYDRFGLARTEILYFMLRELIARVKVLEDS